MNDKPDTGLWMICEMRAVCTYLNAMGEEIPLPAPVREIAKRNSYVQG